LNSLFPDDDYPFPVAAGHIAEMDHPIRIDVLIDIGPRIGGNGKAQNPKPKKKSHPNQPGFQELILFFLIRAICPFPPPHKNLSLPSFYTIAYRLQRCNH
jgi:hypothetical protein